MREKRSASNRLRLASSEESAHVGRHGVYARYFPDLPPARIFVCVPA